MKKQIILTGEEADRFERFKIQLDKYIEEYKFEFEQEHHIKKMNDKIYNILIGGLLTVLFFV